MKSKKFLTPILLILIATLITSVIPTEAEGAVYEDTLRLHIPANSDSDTDQAVKLRIRDLVLESYGERLSGYSSCDAATETAASLVAEVKRDVDAWLVESGVDYECSVSIENEWFDTREYGDLTLPMGYYTALKIVLGRGEGKNWWCVMFPPMCLGIATSGSSDRPLPSYTAEEYRLIKAGKYSVKFKLLELLSECTAEFCEKG